MTTIERPLIFLDIESAVPGKRPDAAADRVVHLAIIGENPTPDGGIILSRHQFKCYPGFAMTAENIAIHGITNEDAAGYPTFREQAKEILKYVEGRDLAGYNSNNYDIPLLWEEFARCGIQWNLADIYKIDVANIFKKKEERTLTAAVKFYCQRDHTEAHGALADAYATANVLKEQLVRYQDLSTLSRAELAAFSAYDNRVDLAGKLVRREDGVVCYNFGKAAGTPVHEDKGFGGWMMRQDFSMNTKLVLQQYLHGQPPGIPSAGTRGPTTPQ